MQRVRLGDNAHDGGECAVLSRPCACSIRVSALPLDQQRSAADWRDTAARRPLQTRRVQSGKAFLFGARRSVCSCSMQPMQDLNRQVVKSDYATVEIPELEFEIPSTTQKGALNTIEGFLLVTLEHLASDQSRRRVRVVP